MSVKITNLCKSFGNKQVLNGVNLTVDANEIVVLMGASGGGKTTLIRCLCNLETADHGSIVIDDNVLLDNGKYCDAKKLKEIQKAVGMVFQNYHLFPHRTVLENICDAPIYQKLMNKEEAKLKAMELLKKLNLEDKANAYPATLSGGQKQRVAIARACILQPKVLCFDEPTSALDQQSIQQLIPVIEELKEQMAIIIITHDIAFGERIGTRTLYMKDINQCEEA